MYRSEKEAKLVPSGNDSQVIVRDSVFSQNYAGSRGAALNLQNIATSRVKLRNLVLRNNTGALSQLEAEHSLPFYTVLTNKRFSLNFFPASKDPLCLNEFSHLGHSDCNLALTIYKTN